jgi:hypothetical protein
MSRIVKHCDERGCCLHDPEAKEFHCIADTYASVRCKNPPYKNTSYCQLHNKRCFQIYSAYKNACDQSFKLKGKNLDHLTDEELKQLIESAKECRRLRIEHFVDCHKRSEEDEMDITHEYAANVADTMAKRAREVLWNRRK